MAGSYQIWRLNTKTQRITLFAGSGREDNTDGKLSESAFSQPSGLSLFAHWLYVADAEDSAVRRIDLRSGSEKVETLVGSGLFDFGDHDGAFANAKLQHGPGVAALDKNCILIVDTNNNRIVSYDMRRGRISDWPVKQ